MNLIPLGDAAANLNLNGRQLESAIQGPLKDAVTLTKYPGGGSIRQIDTDSQAYRDFAALLPKDRLAEIGVSVDPHSS